MNAADDIAEFLATRRAKITPEQAGLPSYGKRRVPGPAPRGGRVAGRRQRRLLPAPGARPGQRRLRARARSAGPGAAARRCRARAPLRSGARREPGRRRSARGRPGRASGRSCSACSTRSRRRRSSATPRRLPGGQRARPRAVRAGLRQPRAAGQQRAVHLPGPGGAPTSSPTGSGWPRSSSRRCARRPGATRTTATSRTSSASCRPAATRSASAGRRTTCASTGPAPSACITRSSASWSSATRR